jgi:predicted nucleotidyltransferase
MKAISSKDDIIDYLRKNKKIFHDQFGVKRIGIFGSFARNTQTSASDIDLIIEIEKDRKNIHNFLNLKRFLENDLERNIDLGFEHCLKPMVREKIKGQILYA